MSTKKQHLYTMAWQRLCAIHNISRRGATAGELARDLGISRSTAVRWLREMHDYAGCRTIKTVGKNGFPATFYVPCKFDEWLNENSVF